MKVLTETKDNEGLEGLLGKTVLLMCANYFYTGKLVGIGDFCVKLEEAKIVYDTGDWSNEEWKEAQSLNIKSFYVQINFIESFGESK